MTRIQDSESMTTQVRSPRELELPHFLVVTRELNTFSSGDVRFPTRNEQTMTSQSQAALYDVEPVCRSGFLPRELPRRCRVGEISCLSGMSKRCRQL